jgi:hypothetical protein
MIASSACWQQRVVPTGFEPVFKPDYNFAIYLRELWGFSSSQKRVWLKHAGKITTIPEFELFIATGEGSC